MSGHIHGSITTARRGGPGGGKCDCELCAPVRKRWEAERTARYREARVLASVGGRYPCPLCRKPCPTPVGAKTHSRWCRR